MRIFGNYFIHFVADRRCLAYMYLFESALLLFANEIKAKLSYNHDEQMQNIKC